MIEVVYQLGVFAKKGLAAIGGGATFVAKKDGLSNRAAIIHAMSAAAHQHQHPIMSPLDDALHRLRALILGFWR